jgi:hypothetical protein
MEPVLERVLIGEIQPISAQSAFEVSEHELGILLRALIRQRARDPEWIRD